MANKGQKFNKLDTSLKYELCMKHFEDGKTEGVLSRQYSIPIGTIRTIFYNYRKGYGFERPRGRKKEDKIDYKERYEILKKYQTFLKEQRKKK